MDILARLERFIREHLPTTTETTVMVGASGGLDSMVLLAALAELAPAKGLRIYPLHYNYQFHHMADAAEETVYKWANQRGLVVVGTRLHRAAEVEQGSGSLEARARELRYQFFQQAGELLGSRELFLAHHQDDQVETVLLNIGRGCGPSGLAGMQPVCNRSNLRLLRPLLDVARDEIVEFAARRKLSYVEDPTNREAKYARNRIRLEILPAWRRAQPDPDSALIGLSRRTGLENSFWKEYLEQLKFCCWPQEIQIEVEQFTTLHGAVQMRLLHYLVNKLTGGQRFDEGNLVDIKELFEPDKSGKRIDLPGNSAAVREYDRVAIYLHQSGDRPGKSGCGEQLEGKFDWGNYGKIISHYGGDDSSDNFCCCISEEQWKKSLLRCWEPGDKIRVRGKNRKLKELFERHKIPFRARRVWPLVVCEGELLAIPGVAVRDGVLQGEGVIIKFLPVHPMFDQIVNWRPN